jgi:hypothetical protein
MFLSLVRPGFGKADPQVMARFRRRVARAEKRGVKKVVGSLSFRPRASVAALFPSAEDVRTARAHSGKGGLQQRWERLALVLFLRLEPYAYYNLGLYDEERFKRAGEFISFRQFVNLHPYLLRAVDAQLRMTIRDKNRFEQFCQEHGIPTAGLIACWEPGQSDPEDWYERIQRLFRERREVFFKPALGLSGFGAGLLSLQADGRWEIRTDGVHATDLGWSEVSGFFAKRGELTIFQDRIRNHAALTRFGTHALHTVRLVTAHLNGKIVPSFAAWKIAAPNAVVDNFAAGGIVVDIDLATGRLGTGAFKSASSPPASLTADPATGERFSGFDLPFWPEIKSLACRLHGLLDVFPTMAPDIAISDSGPIIIETNDTWDGCVFQKASDCGMGGSVFPEIVAQHFRSARRS